MVPRRCRSEDLLVTLACYGFCGLLAAYGMWVAGSPLLPPQPGAARPGCAVAEGCVMAGTGRLR